MNETLPAIAGHLDRYKEKARKRYDQGEYWWELRACDYYDEFEKPKIILPDIAIKGQFTIDRENPAYIVNTAYLIGSSELSLLGILSSSLVDFYYRNISSTYRGGYLRFIRQYLETIPIVNTDSKLSNEIASKVDSVLNLKKENSKADTSLIEMEIDEIVYEMYGLEKQMRKFINKISK